MSSKNRVRKYRERQGQLTRTSGKSTKKRIESEREKSINRKRNYFQKSLGEKKERKNRDKLQKESQPSNQN